MDGSPLSNAIPTFGAQTLEDLDLNPNNIKDGQRIGGNSRRQFVRFYKKIENEVYATDVRIDPKTGSTTVIKTGIRPVEREFVHVVTPGDKNEIETKAEDFHRREFFHAYKNFRDGKGIPLGTSIEECSYIAPALQLELKYRSVHTEEQLADASDLLLEQIPDGYNLREFARANVKVRQDNAASGTVRLLRSQVDELQSALKAQMQQMAEMRALVQAQSGLIAAPTVTEAPEESPRKPGRPRKVDLEA